MLFLAKILPEIPECRLNGIPGGDCHSTTVTVILNDLKCRFENTSFDSFKIFRVIKHRSQKVLESLRK